MLIIRRRRRPAGPFRAPIVLCLLLVSSYGCSQPKNEYVEPPPPEVAVATPAVVAITPFTDSSGYTEAVDEADVNARVEGFIEEIPFDAAADVQQDDVLYQIERDRYQALWEAAKASLSTAQAAIGVSQAAVSNAEAEVEKTQLELQRQQSLMQRNAGSQADLDAAIAANRSAIAQKESAIAQVSAAEAERDRAQTEVTRTKLDLDYTTVRAPIAGTITKTFVKVGNLVQSGTKLASIVSTKPIFANFSISDRELLEFIESDFQNGKPSRKDDWRGRPVYLAREIDDGFPFQGRLEYIDARGVETQTGTLGLRAEFDNEDGRLVPGLFVTIRLPTSEPVETLLIPELAVMRDGQGAYVLEVGSENKVQRTSVTVGKRSGGWAVIESGLSEATQVIIEGLQRARPGRPVTPKPRPLDVDDETLLRGLTMKPQADSKGPTSGSTETDNADEAQDETP